LQGSIGSVHQHGAISSATAQTTILVVDDDEHTSSLVASALRLHGHQTIIAATGRDALAMVESRRPDLVVLGIDLPDVDGFAVLQRMRRDRHEQPVVFLTARDAHDDCIKGLNDGADDYITKPFAIEELVTRVRVVLRRGGSLDRSSRVRYSDLEMDEERHIVRRRGRNLQLTLTEYNLLRFLLFHAGIVVTKQEIIDAVWDHEIERESTVVETFISYLRRKVDADGSPLIHTIRGVGYSLRESRPLDSGCATSEVDSAD
jgi:two-component system OmpR family response regulator